MLAIGGLLLLRKAFYSFLPLSFSCSCIFSLFFVYFSSYSMFLYECPRVKIGC